MYKVGFVNEVIEVCLQKLCFGCSTFLACQRGKHSRDTDPPEQWLLVGIGNDRKANHLEISLEIIRTVTSWPRAITSFFLSDAELISPPVCKTPPSCSSAVVAGPNCVIDGIRDSGIGLF